MTSDKVQGFKGPTKNKIQLQKKEGKNLAKSRKSMKILKSVINILYKRTFSKVHHI